MSLRVTDTLVLLAGIAAGAALEPGTITGDAGRVLVTFLGLVSASILPTVTLLVNSMSSSGRSVQSIERLDEELGAAIDALFLLFGCVAIAIGALVSLSIAPADFLKRVPHLTTDILPRAGQAFLVGSCGLIVWRMGQIPAILRRALTIRKEIAVDEAKRKVTERAPNAEALKDAFATHPDFGKVVTLPDDPPKKPS